MKSTTLHGETMFHGPKKFLVTECNLSYYHYIMPKKKVAVVELWIVRQSQSSQGRHGFMEQNCLVVRSLSN